MTNYSEYLCGGYFLVKRIPRPDNLSNLLPDSIITVSNCFAETAPDEWCLEGYNYEDEERAEEASKLEIPAHAVPELVALMSRESGSLEPNAFPNLAVARKFYRHCADNALIALVGIGLHHTLLQDLLAQQEKDINRGYGLVERIELRQLLAAGGTPLGYEPLGYEATKFHSWLCHYMPNEASERFGIRPNAHGLIDRLEDAVKVTAHMTATGAEPAMWEPWLIVQYGLEV